MRPVRVFAFAVAVAAASWPAAARAGAAQSPARTGDIDVRTSVDRTAIWVADRVTFTIDVTCRRGVDILDDDLSRDKLKLDGLEVIGGEASRQTGSDETTTHRFQYVLTTYRVDLPTLRIASLPVRYYVKRPGQRLEDAAPAGEVQVPGAVIALRSLLPDDQETFALRDGRPATARPALYALVQPVGLGLVIVSIVPAALWLVAVGRAARRRRARRTVRQVRHQERASLEAVRSIDLTTVEGRREAYAMMNTLVRDHLRDVCGIAGPSLTPAEIASALTLRDGRMSAELVAALLIACDHARYGPPGAGPTIDACRETLAQAEQVLAVR